MSDEIQVNKNKNFIYLIKSFRLNVIVSAVTVTSLSDKLTEHYQSIKISGWKYLKLQILA